MSRSLAFVALLLIPALGYANAPVHECSTDAIERASKLLTFHFGEPDNRMEIDKDIKALPPIKNPANPQQVFDVLEVWGSIYKGRYRMHFIYARIPGIPCTLMGQEILEHANL